MRRSLPLRVSLSARTQSSIQSRSKDTCHFPSRLILNLFYCLRGEFVMIRGPSGGGKTTMLNLIGTIDSSSGGELFIMGNRIDKDSSDSFLSGLRLRHIGFVFQTFNLLATMSALENVELPMILLGQHSDKDRKKRAIALLKRVGLGDRLDHLPSELSGGEQ